MAVSLRARAVAIVVAAAGLVAAGLMTLSVDARTGDASSPQKNPQAGKAVYDKNCAECHGPSGRGDGTKAKNLGLRPRDFTLGAFKCRCTTSGPPTDADLMRTITNGMPGTAMASHRDIPEADRVNVIEYLKTLSPKLAGNPPSCPARPVAPASTPASVVDGKRLYSLMGCAACHGASGRGDGPAASSLKDDWGQPIKPFNFVLLHSFKCGNDDTDLYRTLRTGMTGSPMPSFDDALLFAREQVKPASLGGGTDDTAFVNAQPDGAAIQALDAQGREKLVDQRAWSLVHYLRSLVAR